MSFRYFIVTLFVFVLGACSDQPKQRPNADTVIQNPDSPSRPSGNSSGGDVGGLSETGSRGYVLDHVIGRQPTEVREPRVDEENSEDDKIEVNGKKPIVFNGVRSVESSVAGINFGMSYGEASEILSTPYVGGCGSSGDYYLENLCLLWSDEEPRRLRQVYILDGYLGTFNFPEPIGPVPMKSELASVFTEEMGPKGEELLKLSYNKFFEKEESYDCLAEEDCQAVFYNEYINWIMPNLTLIFSKDRKVFIGAIINQDFQPGDFASPIDLIRGEIVNQEKIIKLGDSWDVVRSKVSQETNPSSILETTSYRKDFVGMAIRVDREGVYKSSESFEVDRLEPKGQEPLTNLIVYSNYSEPIMLNGKFVKVTYGQAAEADGAETVSLELTEARPSPEESLSVRMPNLANKLGLQKSLITSLGDLISNEFKATDSTGILSQRISGLNAKQAPNRSLAVRTSFYNKAEDKNSFVYTSISVNTGNMVFGMSLDKNPLATTAMKSVEVAAEASGRDLAGYSLGERVKITDVDRSKEEGFIEIEGQKVRVELSLYSSTQVSFETGLTKHQKLVFVEGLSGVALGVHPLIEIKQDTKEFEADVIYVSSSLNPVGVTGLCGMDHVFKTGITQQTFQSELRAAVQESKESCDVFAAVDTSGAGQASTYYFPKQGVKVYFSDRVLAGMAKYREPGRYDLNKGETE